MAYYSLMSMMPTNIAFAVLMTIVLGAIAALIVSPEHARSWRLVLSIVLVVATVGLMAMCLPFLMRAATQSGQSSWAKVDGTRIPAPTFAAAEAAVLREFFLQGRETLWLPADDAAVARLCEAGVLVRVMTDVGELEYDAAAIEGRLDEHSEPGSEIRVDLAHRKARLDVFMIAPAVQASITPDQIGFPPENWGPEWLAMINRRPPYAHAIEEMMRM